MAGTDRRLKRLAPWVPQTPRDIVDDDKHERRFQSCQSRLPDLADLRSPPFARACCRRYAGLDGAVIGMHTFGSSAPLKDLLTKFGFTPEKVLAAAMKQIEQNTAS